MIDKKAIMLIGVLIVIALLVLVLGFVNIEFDSGDGDSFSALMDEMVEDEPGTYDLVLPSTYVNGDEILITDKIISMSATDYSTSFWFLYSGTEWINESGGTNFDVDQYQGDDIHVRNAIFKVSVSGDWSSLYSVGDDITFRTSVRITGGNPVLSGTWVVIGN